MNVINPSSDKLHPASALGPLICFSHLRWDFVLQRPQHLMERFARERRVFFFEEYIPTDHHLAYLEIHPFAGTSVKSVRPRIPRGWNDAQCQEALASLLDELLNLHGSTKPILWFYTPMMYAFARHVKAAAVVYDCMDELANFRFAPPQLGELESDLMRRADVVFTGGFSLYESKRLLHDNIHAFPSSVDVHHFRAARQMIDGPAEQVPIPCPILGYCGVIDERLDLELIRAVASERRDWSIVLIGPTAKIRPEDLPRGPNIHYLGQKNYCELPTYFSGWSVALMPFAQNEATRFISPTKTPEYLAAGLPVVTTPVADVVRQYGGVTGVFIASDAQEYLIACERALELKRTSAAWLTEADQLLAGKSWDETHRRMSLLLAEACARNESQTFAATKRPRKRARGRPYDFLVVGAGFAGSVLAERLASAGAKRVLICDRRPHLGGNAYDFHNEHGILVHKYGPHIFHTNSQTVFDYLSRFTAWRPYEHRVLADVRGKLLPVPINRTTLNGLYGLDLKDDAQAAAYLSSQVQPLETVVTAKDVVVSQVGIDLYQAFFEGYTRKQWGLDASQLDKAVTARIPARTNIDDRYFLDAFQAMPKDGYTKMFENMLDNERIEIVLATECTDVRREFPQAHTIFTGPIDEFFDYRFGHLPYRSLRFQHETHDTRRVLPVAVVNYPSEDVPYTRVTEFKHLTGQVHPRTSLCYECACSEGDPYYPIPREENQALYRQYETLARTLRDVTFVGRLATYKYYNMDQVVGQALATFNRMQNAALPLAGSGVG
jgi:UDP-galactopyranose mutase